MEWKMVLQKENFKRLIRGYCKLFGKKQQHFLNDAFHSYYDLFQVN